MLVQMPIRSESDLVRFVLPRLRLVFAQVVGNWSFSLVRHTYVNRLSLMEEFVLMVILPSLSAWCQHGHDWFPLRGHIESPGKTIEVDGEQKNIMVQPHNIKRCYKNVEANEFCFRKRSSARYFN